MSAKELLDRVQLVTKRPDARALSLDKLNALIAHICNNADWPEDLVETSLSNATPTISAVVVPLVLADGLPAIRKIEYLTANDKPLKAIKPRNALSSTGCPAKNVYYKSGNSLVVNSERPAQNFRLGYYQIAGRVTDQPTSTHWLIETQDAMMYQGVCAKVFQATGDDNSYQIYMGEFNNLYSEFRRMRVDSEEL